MSSTARRKAPALLRAARKARRQTQRQLAAWLGCHASMVAQMERGLVRPGRQLANRMDALLDIPASVWDEARDLRARAPEHTTTAAGGAR